MDSDRYIRPRNDAWNDRNACESVFRADTDAMGRWFVWERLGPAGWVTIEPCVCHEEASRLAGEMNARLQRTEYADNPPASRPEIMVRREHRQIGGIDARATPGTQHGN